MEMARITGYVEGNILDKPEEFFTLEKLRAAAHVDRRITLREIIEKIFGMIPYFKPKTSFLMKSLINLTAVICQGRILFIRKNGFQGIHP